MEVYDCSILQIKITLHASCMMHCRAYLNWIYEKYVFNTEYAYKDDTILGHFMWLKFAKKKIHL